MNLYYYIINSWIISGLNSRIFVLFPIWVKSSDFCLPSHHFQYKLQLLLFFLIEILNIVVYCISTDKNLCGNSPFNTQIQKSRLEKRDCHSQGYQPLQRIEEAIKEWAPDDFNKHCGTQKPSYLQGILDKWLRPYEASWVNPLFPYHASLHLYYIVRTNKATINLTSTKKTTYNIWLEGKIILRRNRMIWPT